MEIFDTDEEILEELEAVSATRRGGDWDNSLPRVGVEIPERVKVSCPKYGRRDVSGIKCSKCDKFDGVVQKSWSADTLIPWSSKYAIRCGYVLERTATEMVE